jgi:hypothetical protein
MAVPGLEPLQPDRYISEQDERSEWDEWKMSSRAHRALQSFPHRSLATDVTLDKLLEMRGVGRKTIGEIARVFSEKGHADLLRDWQHRLEEIKARVPYQRVSPEPPREVLHLSVLSNSAITCFRRCPREFKFRYIQLRRPRRASEALRFGTFFHAALEAWWARALLKPCAPEDRLEAALLVMRARAEEKPEDADPFDLVKAEELMLGYTARWGGEPLETVAVEKTFDVPLVNPISGRESKTYRVKGKIDVVARKANGKLTSVEHKTTSSDISPGTDYWRKVSALDPQVSTYHSGARAAGFELEDCTYDVIRKVGLRPLKATPIESRKFTKDGFLYKTQRETDEGPEEYRLRVREDIAANPEKYFARGPVVRLEDDEREHAGDVWQTAWMLRESENAGRFPRSPGACERFHRLCEYFDVCSGTASIDDDTRFRTAETAHEELIREV